nr:immunoglobulin heavy chain junction region [Macaca mulatta]MOV48913.1 immunoglobulin heavy chain junction region [Macaca mulatta]MOV50205.1 immunoglobulin heavy chain junction region [Macaca mulatta]MOV50230.1 immunoglobulin heavy chain junction region [Macaca mulatta]MOV51548.1 immunoglobulin heavy chain junction region [Macaca mulatta]
CARDHSGNFDYW